MSLTSEAVTLIDEARAEARKRGHEEVTVEHLVLGALGVATTLKVLARRAIDMRRLQAMVEGRLSTIAPIAGYRDAPAESRLSRSLLDVIETASRRRKLLFFQRPTRAIDLLLAAFAVPPIAAIIEEATFDVSPVERLSDAAKRIAVGYAHRNVLVDHALLAMIDEDARFGEALSVLGHDPKAVRRRLDRRLAPNLRSHLLAPLGSLVELAAMRTYLAPGQHELTLMPVVVELLKHPSVRTAVEAASVNRYDLLYAYVHGRAPPKDSAFRSDGMVDVVFHDDSFSTMEFVVATLTSDFGLTEAEAKKRMLAIHEESKAVVATMPRDRAMACIIRAQGSARDQLMPLRMEMVQSVDVSMTKR